MKMRNSVECPACGGRALQRAGLFRCECGWSPSRGGYWEPLAPVSKRERLSDEYDRETREKPADGKLISLVSKFKG